MLRAPIAAGTWRLVADGVVYDPVDVTFEIIWRSGSGDTVLATFEHQFDPLPDDEYVAQPFEATADLDAVPAEAGDELVFRYSGDGTTVEMAYAPNGEGERLGGRQPFIDLPAAP